MTIDEYRADIQKRLEKTRESLEFWSNDELWAQRREGNDKPQDLKPIMIANNERLIETYENILKQIDKQFD